MKVVINIIMGFLLFAGSQKVRTPPLNLKKIPILKPIVRTSAYQPTYKHVFVNNIYKKPFRLSVYNMYNQHVIK